MSVYISYSKIDKSNHKIFCPIQSCTILTLIKYINQWDSLSVLFIKQDNSDNTNILIDITGLKYKTIEEISLPVAYCQLPVYYDEEYYCVAGLCSVLRQLVKMNPDFTNLLGFRENCLSACAEQSSWTKFCEIDSMCCVNYLLEQNICWIKHIWNLEEKLKCPLKIHNKVPLKDIPDENSRYCDSMQFSLSDLILITCVHIIHLYTNKEILVKFPYVQKWYDLILSDTSMSSILSIFLISLNESIKNIEVNKIIEYAKNNIDSKLITKAQKARKFATRLSDAVKFVNHIQPRIEQRGIGCGDDLSIKLEDIPYFALPESGDLPKDRVERKIHQLLSMTKAVMKICSPNNTIIDFCSGGGHLGILIAYLIPQCRVVLLDNKVMSLAKAKLRCQKLNLTNLYIIQSNVDYFIGKFQIGICLHACGVASDLVMIKCAIQSAAMVVSPCCYGKIQTCHTVEYPRSKWLRGQGISQHDHHLMSHCADRDAPEWMDWVDADRLEWAQENGYNVYLGKLTPLNCTPKNNLLVLSKTIKVNQFLYFFRVFFSI